MGRPAGLLVAHRSRVTAFASSTPLTDAELRTGRFPRPSRLAEPLADEVVSALVPAGVELELSWGGQPAYWYLIAAE